MILAFTTLVGGINDQQKEEEKVDEGPKRKVIKGMDNCTFSDVTTLKPLGAGGFGLVKLVEIKGKYLTVRCWFRMSFVIVHSNNVYSRHNR